MPETAQQAGVNPHHLAAAHVQIADPLTGRLKWPGGRREKTAIVGFASCTRDMAPYDDPSWEIWGLNQLYSLIPRADRWFEIHDNWNEHVVPGRDHEAWIKGCGIPVYMNEYRPELVHSVRLPIERLIAKFSDYFTSTISFMLALAIDEIDEQVAEALKAGVEANGSSPLEIMRAEYAKHTIGVWGVDLIVGDEWSYQKPCAEYFLGQADGRGIRVQLPSETALCKTLYRYGYEREPDFGPIKFTEMIKRRDALNQDVIKRQQELSAIQGALQETLMWLQLLELRMRGGTVGAPKS